LRYGSIEAVTLESTAIYLDLLEDLDAIFWEADPQTQRFTSVSQKAEALLGYPRSAWTSNPTFWTDILHPDDRQRVLNTRARAIKGCEDYRFDYRVLTAEGHTRWIRDTVQMRCERGQPKRIYGVMIDVTATLEPQQRESYYRAIIEHSADAIALLDGDGTVRFVSGAVERLSGFSPNELIGMDPLSRIHPDDLAHVSKALQNCRRHAGDRVSIEYRALHRNGSWQHREVIAVNRLDDPSIRAIIVNYRDITDRKRSEEALVESQDAFTATFQEAPIGIGHTSLEGRWLRVNRRLCDLLGYGPEELTTMNFKAITHPEDVGQDTEALTQLLAGTIQKYEREKRYRHRDGHFVSAKLTAVLHRDSTGAPKYFIAIIEDVADRVRLEGQLRQSQKMESVGRLAGGIAHDFNNLLTVILCNAEMLQPSKTAEDLDGAMEVEQILQAGARAAALTRQLLAFSRKQVLELTVLDINALVEEMSEMLRRLIGEHIEFHCCLAPNLVSVVADRSQIEQVVMNLVVNARDALPEGGVITLQTKNVILDELSAQQHPDAPPGAYATISVADTGIGMDAQTKDRVFEPFFTTKEKGEGTGLGLSTVYGIVKQSDGYLSVDSELGHGSTFKISLPKSRLAAGEANSPALEPLLSADRGETILLVEDEDSVRHLVRTVLIRRGYCVFDASNAADAFRLADAAPQAIDLLIADVVMPGASGPTVFEQLSGNHPLMKVIFISGYPENMLGARGRQARSAAYLQKPFSAVALVRKVREVLDRTCHGT
jgi:PAS domain S-box-containing protein